MGSGASRIRKQRTTSTQQSRNSTLSFSQAVDTSTPPVQLNVVLASSNSGLSPDRGSDGGVAHSYPGSNESSPDDREEASLRAHFAQSAMSLGMDNDDLIFNILYFGQSGVSIQSMFNTALEETLAAHSAENTPYKLHPATEEALGRLRVLIMSDEINLEENECAICQEDMEIGDEIVFMPACSHCFHNECMQRWLKLQNWCPVCRSQIVKTNTAQSLETVKANLGEEFLNCSDDEEKTDQDGGSMAAEACGLRPDRSVEEILARQTIDKVLESAVIPSPIRSVH